MRVSLIKYKEFILENLKVFVGMGGSLALFLIVIMPSFTSIPGLYSSNKEADGKLALLKTRLGKIDSLVASQQSVRSSVVLADKALPSKDDVPELLNQVQSLATSSAVSLKSLQFSGISKAAEGNFNKISVQAAMEGSYGNIVSMLSNFENTSRIINLGSLSFDSSKGGESLEVTLGLISYYLESDPRKVVNANLDLTSKNINSTLEYLKKLKPYESQRVEVNVGKSNPFE